MNHIMMDWGPELCSRTLFICPVYNSLCLLIPVSHSVPLLLPLQPRFKASVVQSLPLISWLIKPA